MSITRDHYNKITLSTVAQQINQRRGIAFLGSIPWLQIGFFLNFFVNAPKTAR